MSSEVCLEPVKIRLGVCGKVKGESSMLYYQLKLIHHRENEHSQLLHRQRQFPNLGRFRTSSFTIPAVLEDIQTST